MVEGVRGPRHYEAYGIDGADIPEGELLVSRSKFQVVDRRQ